MSGVGGWLILYVPLNPLDDQATLLPNVQFAIRRSQNKKGTGVPLGYLIVV